MGIVYTHTYIYMFYFLYWSEKVRPNIDTDIVNNNISIANPQYIRGREGYVFIFETEDGH